MKHISFSFVICTLSALFLLSCNQPKSLDDVKYQSVAMKTAEADSGLSDTTVNIKYKFYSNNIKSDETLVFVHGFGCDINAWKEQFSYFKGKAKMVFINLPGFGQSDKPDTQYTLDLFADAVKTVLDKLEIRDAVLIGHSLGTAVCRQVVLKYPQLASKLVDIDGVYCFYPAPAEMIEMYEAFAESFKGEDITQVLIDFTKPLNTPNTPAEVVDYAMQIMPKTRNYVAYSTMRNLINEKYWDGTTINIPTLVFASVNSQIPPDYAQIMGSLYTDMEYHELSDSGHFIMMEQPQMFNQALQSFMEK